VIDDEPAIRTLIRRILTPVGVLTDEFDSAEAFLSDLQGRSMGCILLDLNLPGISGLEMLQRLRSEGVPDPVIMISGQAEIPLALDALRAGALDFIAKPFEKEKLLRSVGGAFEAVRKLEAAGAGNLKLLSAREREVLKVLEDGSSNKVVARALGLSTRTVENHRANIVRKLGVENLTQALFLAKDAGVLA
jgi:two-component system response regulator FixJ